LRVEGAYLRMRQIRCASRETETQPESVCVCVCVCMRVCVLSIKSVTNTDWINDRRTHGHMDRDDGARELYLLYHNAVVWLLVSFIENPKNELVR
jgi:hypothetical protein